jgi:glycosyltransferase involved in cell wall biosynthesis
MKVEINARPLGWGYAGVSTYLTNLIAQLRGSYSDLELRFATDKVFEALPSKCQSVVSPRIRDLKTQVLWESISFPMHTISTKPDVVHTPYHTATAWSRGCRVLTVHDCFLWDNTPSDQSQRLYRSMLELSVKRAHAILTVSEYSRNRIVETFHIDPRWIFVSPLAASGDLSVPRSFAQIEDFRKRTGIGIDRPYILYAGGTARHKGILSLIEAYGRLDPDLRACTDLLLVGGLAHGNAHHDEIRDAIAELQPPGKIIAAGALSQSDLGTAYQAAIVFVFPSSYEGFGLSPLEAMQCGVPVVVSNRTSIPEVVGDAALLIDPDDSLSISCAITSVLASHERRRNMRAASLARASTFSWARTAERTVAAYTAALER